MKLGAAVAEILKREGIEILTGYPVNHLIEFAAAADIRPVMVRQERIGIHMADAISRLSSGRKIGAFCMQYGPGAENGFGGVAQCYGESVPVLIIPGGYVRRLAHIAPNFNPSEVMRPVTKSAESIDMASEVVPIMRRAFSRLRNGRGGPVVVQIPMRHVRRRGGGAARLHPGAEHPLRARPGGGEGGGGGARECQAAGAAMSARACTMPAPGPS